MTLTRQMTFWVLTLVVGLLVLYVLREILLPFVAGMALAYLLDPLATRQGAVGRVTLDYEYRLSVPRQQPSEGAPPDQRRLELLEPDLHAAVSEAIARIDQLRARDESAESTEPLCPPPPGTSEDDAQQYLSYGVSHYSFEVVGDMPIQWRGECHLGRLVDWFGRYQRPKGLVAQLWMKRPASDNDERTFAIEGRRSLRRVEFGLAEPAAPP